jgi:ribosomal protein L7/L12
MEDRHIIELAQRVGRLERQIAFLLEHLGLEYEDAPTEDVSPAVLELVRMGKKIQAIKLFREETGYGLKEAKDFIDSLDV